MKISDFELLSQKDDSDEGHFSWRGCEICSPGIGNTVFDCLAYRSLAEAKADPKGNGRPEGQLVRAAALLGLHLRACLRREAGEPEGAPLLPMREGDGLGMAARPGMRQVLPLEPCQGDRQGKGGQCLG
jgi:hypothetical protein